MKTIERTQIWTAALLLAASISVNGQDADPFAGFGGSEPVERFNLQLSGATVGELVEIVQSRTKSHLNIVVPAQDVGLPVPDLDLREVTFSQVAAMLGHATRNSEQFLVFEEVDGGWVFQTQPGRGRSTERVRSWVIEDLLEHYELDDILALLDTTLELDGGQRPASPMKLHGETGALLGMFEDREAQIIEQLLTQLRQNRARPTAPSRGQLEEMEKILGAELEETEVRLHRMLQERAEIGLELATLKDEGKAEQAARLAANLDLLQLETEMLKQRLHQLREQQSGLEMRLRTGMNIGPGFGAPSPGIFPQPSSGRNRR